MKKIDDELEAQLHLMLSLNFQLLMKKQIKMMMIFLNGKRKMKPMRTKLSIVTRDKMDKIIKVHEYDSFQKSVKFYHSIYS